MKHISLIKFAGIILLTAVIAGCGSSPEIINQEASTSAIRAAQEVGASEVPNAALYLQLAKEGLENAKALALNGKKEQAESMLLRSQADAELSIILSHGEADKTEAAKALENVKKLRQENK